MEIRYYGDKLSQRIAKTPEGFLICQDVPISRTGYQEYLAKEIMDNPINENKVIYVYRPAKEVFDIRSLASFEGKPVTNEHPEEDVTPENYNKYSCGHVQNVHVGEGEDSNKVLADLYITDPVLIKLIEDGKREVSCGYYAEEKKDNDGRLCQTKIRGNHVAVVRSGRAGNKVCIRDHNPFADNHVNSLSDYIDGLRYIKDEGKNRIAKAKNKKRNAFDSLEHFYGDERMNYYDDDEVMYDDDEILEDDDDIMYDDDEILEDDDDDIMYDDDEILEDDDELITDAGVKGMKKGQHVKARDPEYLAALKGGAVGAGAAAAGYGAYKGGKAILNKNINPDAALSGQKYSTKTRTGRALNAARQVKGSISGSKPVAAVTGAAKSAGNSIKNRAVWGKGPLAKGYNLVKKAAGAAQSAGNSIKNRAVWGKGPLAKGYNLIKNHPKAMKRGALGLGLAAAGGIGAAIGARRNRGDSWYYDDDELMNSNNELMLEDDDDIMYDDDELLEDACKYHDEDEILEDDDDIMYDDDEILEDEDDIMYDDDELLEDEDEELLDDDELLEDEDEEIPMSDADEVIQNAKEAIADARYAINKINRRLRDSEVVSDIEDDEEELMDDDEILEDDDDIMYDDDELLEDEDEELFDDDEELLDDDELLEDEDEILEDDEEELLDDDEVLEDDDEILEDDDEFMYDDDELLEDDDLEITETEDIQDDNPEADAIDLDKTKALREITEASRGVTDPNERKQLQDAIYGALCKKSQMSDIMRVTKRNKAARMDSAYNSKKVSVADQQAIYDSFNPHKKTSF